MTSTIFGITGSSAFSEGMKEGVGLTQYPEQQRSQTSLLSDKAEESKMALAAHKEAAANEMARRASLQETMAANPELKLSSLSDQIKAREIALESPAAKANIPMMQQLLAEKNALHKQQAESAVEMQNQNNAQQEVVAQALNNFLVDPTNTSILDGAMGEDIGLRNKGNLSNLKKLFAKDTNIPMAESLYALPGQKGKPGDNQRTFWQLTAEEQERAKFNIRQGNDKLKQAQADSLALSKLQLGYGNLAEKMRNDDLDAAATRQRTALKKEALEKPIDKSTEITRQQERLTDKKEKLQEKMDQIKVDYGADLNAKEGWIFKTDKVPQAVRDQYTRYTSQMAEYDKAYADNKLILEGAHTAGKPKTEPTTPVAKDTKVVVPSRPANVPAGAQYSPSRKEWWLNGKKVG